MKKYILPFIIGMVLSGCLAPSVPVDKTELDRCKKKDTNSCVSIAKQMQVQYDTIEKSGDKKAKKKLGSIQKDILKYHDLACGYGDFNSCNTLASIYSSKVLRLYKSDDKKDKDESSKEAKVAYMYMRKACDIDKTKCPLDPKNFFAKNDEKLANIVWLALKDEKPKKLLNLNKSVKHINDIDDTIYHLSQACVINKDEDCESLVNKVGIIKVDTGTSYKYLNSVWIEKGSRLCETYKYSAEACLFNYLVYDRQLSLILAKVASGMLLSKDELAKFVDKVSGFKNVLDRHYPNKDNNGGSYFKPNADNTCLDIGETDYLLYYLNRYYSSETEEKKEYLRLRTQFKDDYVKEMEKLHPNKFSDGYIDCSVNIIKTLSKTRVSSYMDKIIANVIKERFDTLLDKCMDKNDKKSCELIVSDYNKIKVISYGEASNVYKVRGGMEYFINTYYKAMQGKSVKVSSSPYGDTQKKIANAVIKKFPNQLEFPMFKEKLFFSKGDDGWLFWNGCYCDWQVDSMYDNASKWGGVDFANQKLMELLNQDVNKAAYEFAKAIQSDGTISNKAGNIKDIMHKVEPKYNLFGAYSNEKFEALKSPVAYDVMFYYLAPETTRLIRKFDDKYKVKKVFLSLIEKQVQVSKEKIIKYIEKQNDIKVAKERKEAAKRERERKEAFERCKKSPQCMAQLRAKAQELRKQSRKYYMMATNARTNQEYKEYKEQADIACGRAINIEQTGEDPGYFRGMFIGAFLGVEHCL